MRKTTALSAGLCVLFAACAAERPFTVKCKVLGSVDSESSEYVDIVEGEFPVDPARLAKTPELEGGCCSTVDTRSDVFGNLAGTTLQIIASRCGPGPVYLTSKLVLNGLPMLAHIVGDTSRVVFNEDDSHAEQSPIETPEGTFWFIYWDCNKKPAPAAKKGKG